MRYIENWEYFGMITNMRFQIQNGPNRVVRCLLLVSVVLTLMACSAANDIQKKEAI